MAPGIARQSRLTQVAIALEYRRYVPALAVILAVLFIAASVFPYQIVGDAAYQIKTVQQYWAGQSPAPNVLRFANPSDLSADQDTWLFWWPPLPTIIFAGVLFAKWPIGPTVRVFVYLITLLGSIGWMQVALLLPLSRRARMLGLAAVVVAALTLHTPYELDTFDVFSFALQPWLFLAALRLRLHEPFSSWRGLRLAGLCFALGAVYWVKFSAVLGAVALLVFVFWQVAQAPLRSGLRLFLISAGAAVFVIPIWLLNLLNRLYSGSATIISSHIAFGAQPSWKQLFLYSAGGPGLSLFGVGMTWNHFLGKFLPNYHPEHAIIAPLGYVGLIGSGLLIATLLWSRRRLNRNLVVLAILTAVVPSAALSYMMLRTGVVYPLIGTRHVLPYWVFLEFLAVGMFSDWLDKPHHFPTMVLVLAVCAYVIVPLGYDCYRFFRFQVLRHVPQSYTSSRNRLSVQTLSQSNAARIGKLVSSNLRDPRDLVVMATTHLGMDSWLEIPQRMMPLTSFWGPLQRQFGSEGTSIAGKSPLRSSRNLRVILVVSNLYPQPDHAAMIRSIMARFPQAHRWITVEDHSGENSDASLWYADLDVSEAESGMNCRHDQAAKPVGSR
jgi:hypothetical protein